MYICICICIYICMYVCICRVKLGCDMLTNKVWCDMLQKYIGSTSNAESKPLKSMYFMSDAYTCKILKVSSLFATRSSGQRNEHFIIIYFIYSIFIISLTT